MKCNRIKFDRINPFDFSVNYIEIDSKAPENQNEHHVHNECEIYLNLSGDISFVVEDTVYPIVPGSIIITRPYEYHHCVYHSNALHKHYWILFSADGNEEYLDIFFRRTPGERNLLISPPEQTEKLISVVEKLICDDLTPFLKYNYFFELIDLMNKSQINENPTGKNLSPDLVFALQYFNRNLALPISMSDVASLAHVSLNTLERHFIKAFHLSPTEYLKRRRLGFAMELLHHGSTVSEASFESGFTDCSAFIHAFKKQVGTTPLQYKKMNSRL